MYKKEKKEKVYFGFLPKDELLKFFERLKMALALGKKTGDKKNFEFEIKGTTNEPNGFSLNIHTFDKNEYYKLYDDKHEYIKKALCIFSLHLKDKSGGRDLKKIEEGFETIKNSIINIPILKKYECEMYMRNDGKYISFDIISINEEIMESLLAIGINLSEYHEFNLSLKSEFNVYELFYENINVQKILSHILSFLFRFKSSGENVKYLIEAISNALNDVKLNNTKMQKKFNETVKFLNFIYAFVGARIKFNYDGQLIAKQINNKNKVFQDSFIKSFKEIKSIIKLFLEASKFLENAINDEISLSFGIPKFFHGYVLNISNKGLKDVVRYILY